MRKTQILFCVPDVEAQTNSTTFLTDSTDITRIHFSSRLNLKQRSELGQFLTPAPIARFMARQFSTLSGHVKILNSGAGVGVLTAAFVERLLANPNNIIGRFCSRELVAKIIIFKFEQIY